MKAAVLARLHFSLAGLEVTEAGSGWLSLHSILDDTSMYSTRVRPSMSRVCGMTSRFFCTLAIIVDSSRSPRRNPSARCHLIRWEWQGWARYTVYIPSTDKTACTLFYTSPGTRIPGYGRTPSPVKLCHQMSPSYGSPGRSANIGSANLSHTTHGAVVGVSKQVHKAERVLPPPLSLFVQVLPVPRSTFPGPRQAAYLYSIADGWHEKPHLQLTWNRREGEQEGRKRRKKKKKKALGTNSPRLRAVLSSVCV